MSKYPHILPSGRVRWPDGREVAAEDPQWQTYRLAGQPYTRDLPGLEWTPAEEIEASAAWGRALVRDLEAVQLAAGVNRQPGLALGLTRILAEPQRLLTAGQLHAAYDALDELLSGEIPIEARSLATYAQGELKARLGGDR